MIQFQCDYNEGAHPKVMQRLMETNMEQTVGYGEDHYCEAARRLIQEACGNPNLQVHFLVGGTQTNTTCFVRIKVSLLQSRDTSPYTKRERLNTQATRFLPSLPMKVRLRQRK